MSDRYAGKPFLRLLDSYVLDAIGKLDPEEDTILRVMEPKFHKTFVTKGTWREIVVSRMSFPPGIDRAIREVWEKGRTRYIAAHGSEPDPVQFTRHFIDTKFPH